VDGFLIQAFIYLIAAVVAVPVAKRLGLGSVLGYLAAGIVIGPLLGVVGAETRDLQHFAEIGVVMMLFLVGLELNPQSLWAMRHRLVGLGGLQVTLTAAAVTGVAMLCGLHWTMALAIGLTLALSSTAIVVQTLTERGLMRTEGGQSSFAVLLFQDIAVIFILAFLPLLATSFDLPHAPDAPTTVEQTEADPATPDHGEADAHAAADSHGDDAQHAPVSLVDGQPGWAVALITLGAIAFVVLGGHFLSRPVFRFIAEAGLREVFTAAALLLVSGIALLMIGVGLSPALGTFLAGVVLANSEFRVELESTLEPFKGLLLGLFFITVGAGIDFVVLADAPFTIIGLTLGLIALKALVLLVISLIFGIRSNDRLLFTLGLAQAGEFGFVLVSFSLQNHVLTPDVGAMVSLIVGLSMILTPGLFILYAQIVRRLPHSEDQPEEDIIDEPGSVIIAGHGRFGQIVNRLLLSVGHRPVVVDHKASLVDVMRRFGFRGYFGDASRPDILHAAGLSDATALVVAIDDPERTVEIVAHARRERPDLIIIARARDRANTYALMKAGADHIIRETFESALSAGTLALQAVGQHPYSAKKLARAFADHDRETVRLQAETWDPSVSVFQNPAHLALVRQRAAEIETLLQQERGSAHLRAARGWTPPYKPRLVPDPDPDEPASDQAEVPDAVELSGAGNQPAE